MQKKTLQNVGYCKADTCGNCNRRKDLISTDDASVYVNGTSAQVSQITAWNFCELTEEIVDDEFVCDYHQEIDDEVDYSN